MNISLETILIIKYAAAVVVLGLIIMAPAYLAAQNKKGKYDTMRIRAASWLFGWTGIGWIIALVWAIKK